MADQPMYCGEPMGSTRCASTVNPHTGRCVAYGHEQPADDSADYRARVLEVLQDAYGHPEHYVDSTHTEATDAIVEIIRDLTRDLSEEVARLRLADADRAARDLAFGWADHRAEAERLLADCVDSDGNPPEGPELATTVAVAHVHATLALGVMLAPIAEYLSTPRRIVLPANGKITVHPAPDAASTPAPVPASDDAQRGDDEAHSGSQGAPFRPTEAQRRAAEMTADDLPDSTRQKLFGGSRRADEEEPECTCEYPYPPEVWTGHHPNCWLVVGGPGPGGSQGSEVDRG